MNFRRELQLDKSEEGPNIQVYITLSFQEEFKYPVHAISILDKGAIFVDKTHKEDQTDVFAL